MTLQAAILAGLAALVVWSYRAKIGMFLLGTTVKAAAPVAVQVVEKAAPVVETSIIEAAKQLVEIGESEARRMRINSAAEQLQKIAVMASTPIQSHTIAPAVPHPATQTPPADPGPTAPK